MHSSRIRTACCPYLPACTASGGCTWSHGVYLVPGGCTWSQGVYLVRGGVPGPGGCTWSWGYLVPGGVPSLGGVPGPRGCTWYLVPGGCTWSRGVYLVLGDVPAQVPPPPPWTEFWKYYLYYKPALNQWVNSTSHNNQSTNGVTRYGS